MKLKRATSLTLILSSLFFLFALLRPVDDLDLFTQLTLGKLLVAERSLLTSEPFSFTAGGSIYNATGWLAQVAGHCVFNLGSWPLLRMLAALTFASAFFLSAVTTTKAVPGYTPLSLSLGMVMGYLTLLSNSSIRPQLISLLGVAILHYMCRTTGSTALRLLIFIPIAIVWQNFHPSLSVAIVVVSLFMLNNLWELWAKGGSFRWDLPILFIISAVCQFLTPLGTRVLELSTLNLYISRHLLGISEWMPPWNPIVAEAMMPFWICLFVTGFLLFKTWKKLSFLNLLLITSFTALSLYSARFTFYWGILLIPFWAEHLTTLLPRSIFTFDPEERSSIGGKTVFIFLSINLIGASLLTLGRQFDPFVPDQAVAALKESAAPGNVYNYREWGGIITFFGAPEFKVMIDGRLYLYSPEEWKRYEAEALGQVSLEEIEARYSPTAFFLHNSFHRALIDKLIKLPRWRIAYAQNDCVVFVPADNLKK